MKMPEPMMPPMTIMVASKAPSRRARVVIVRIISVILSVSEGSQGGRSFAVGACPERAQRVERAAQDDGIAVYFPKTVSDAEVDSGQSDRPEDRRQFHRIHLDAPLPAYMRDVPVKVLDVSLNGARIVSDARFSPGSEHELQFTWNDMEARLLCEVVRCTLFSFAKAPGEKSLYQSGVRIKETIGNSDRVLRELIGSYVIRALEEQKANARGLPPLGPYAYIEGKGDRFRRCGLGE